MNGYRPCCSPRRAVPSRLLIPAATRVVSNPLLSAHEQSIDPSGVHVPRGAAPRRLADAVVTRRVLVTATISAVVAVAAGVAIGAGAGIIYALLADYLTKRPDSRYFKDADVAVASIVPAAVISGPYLTPSSERWTEADSAGSTGAMPVAA